MVESAIVMVQNYLTAVRRSGLHVSRAVLYGSYAGDDAHSDSDIDILVIATEFVEPYDRTRVDLLWELRA